MKKIFVFAALAAMVAFTACTKEISSEIIEPAESAQEEVQPGYVRMSFSAAMEQDLTKAYLSGKSVLWTGDESIAVFDHDAGGAANKFDIEGSGASASFTGTVPVGATHFTAIYPYSDAIVYTAGGSSPIMTVIPAVQEATLNSFDPAAATFVATATSSDAALTFTPAFALFKVNVDVDDVVAVCVSTTTNNLAGSIKVARSGNVGDGSGDMSKVIVLKKSDGSVLTKGVYYIVTRFKKNYENFTLKYFTSEALINSRVSVTGIAADGLQQKDIMNLGSLSAFPDAPHYSWYEYYQAGFDVTIAGKTFNKSVDGDAALVAPGSAAQLPLTATVNFLEAGNHVNTNMQKPSALLAIKSDDPSNRATLKPVKSWAVLDFAAADIDIDLADQTGATMFSNNSDYITSDAAFFNMENCTVSVPVENQYVTTFYATQSGKTLYSVVSFDIRHCRFITPGTGASPGNKLLLSTLFSINKAHTKAENIKSLVFSNNVYCYTGTGGYKGQVFNYGTNASSTTESDWDMSVEFDNNIIYNIASSSGYFRTQWIKEIQMNKNVFVVPDVFDCGGDPKFYAMLAEPSSRPTGTLSDNIVQGTTNGTWKITSKASMNVAGLADTGVDVTDGGVSLFSSSDPTTGTFTMAAGYESYGPQE